jgi:DNA helicase IV
MKDKAPIKLLYAGTTSHGVDRYQSQLYVGRDTCDFIIEDGELKVYEWRSEGGYQFYKTDIPYTIVKDVKEMRTQQL